MGARFSGAVGQLVKKLAMFDGLAKVPNRIVIPILQFRIDRAKSRQHLWLSLAVTFAGDGESSDGKQNVLLLATDKSLAGRRINNLAIDAPQATRPFPGVRRNRSFRLITFHALFPLPR